MKVAVAVTGGSGAIYAIRLLEKLKVEEIMLTVTPDGMDLLKFEAGIKGNAEKFDLDQFKTVSPVKYFKYKDYFAPIASGSNNYDALVVVPCTMNTLGKIASGVTDNMVIRGADTMLKERKKLILVTRETPYNLIHIRNMETVTLAGGIIMPASPGFYHKPESINDLVDFVVNKILDQLGLPKILPDWGKNSQSSKNS